MSLTYNPTQLDEDGIKEKRKQRLLKAGWEARVRARKEKEREREEKEAEERREAEERERDLNGWAEKLKREHEATMNRMKDRSRRKAALLDRKSAQAQARMKSIASLAADDRVPKKRRKAGGGAFVLPFYGNNIHCHFFQRTCSAQTMRTGRSTAK